MTKIPRTTDAVFIFSGRLMHFTFRCALYVERKTALFYICILIESGKTNEGKILKQKPVCDYF